MSVIGQVTATPNRIIATYEFVRTVRKPGIDQSDLEQLMSPAALSRGDLGSGGSSIARGVIGEALNLGILERSPEGKLSATEGVDGSDMSATLELILLGLSDHEPRDQDDFPRALAWILEQPPSRPIPWHEDLRSRIASQVEGDDDFGIGLFSMWQQFAYWARFLGFVQFAPDAVIPDPLVAIRRHMSNVFGSNNTLTVRDFLRTLGDACPVFETGRFRTEIRSMFKQANHGEDDTAISRSTALAVLQLESEGRLKLENQSDASSLIVPDWTGIGDGRQVTHVAIAKGVAHAS